MKTLLTSIALLSSLAAPAAFAAELNGLHLPAGITATHAAATFAGALVMLIVLRDYDRPNRATALSRGLRIASSVSGRSAHPLAA